MTKVWLKKHIISKFTPEKSFQKQRSNCFIQKSPGFPENQSAIIDGFDYFGDLYFITDLKLVRFKITNAFKD